LEGEILADVGGGEDDIKGVNAKGKRIKEEIFREN
jgi:hypothetical protein